MLLRDDPLLVIRKYGSCDRPAVRRICCETALMGKPSAVFFDDDEIFADALTAYYTDYEPESCFVAERDKKIVGYLLGTKDVRRMDKIYAGRIALSLIVKALVRGVFFRKTNVRFLSRVFLSLVKSEFRAPSFLKDYPAALHINIIEECRAAGIGSKLINAYLDYLVSQKVKGVHLSTMSDKANLFFSRLNFQLLFKGQRSYFRYFLGRNVPIYIYGMQVLRYTLRNKG